MESSSSWACPQLYTVVCCSGGGDVSVAGHAVRGGDAGWRVAAAAAQRGADGAAARGGAETRTARAPTRAECPGDVTAAPGDPREPRPSLFGKPICFLLAIGRQAQPGVSISRQETPDL